MSEFLLDFDKVFSDFVEANQKKWGHNRNETLGASETFVCIRKGFFDKRGADLGYEPDPEHEDDWGATRRGDMIENHHVVPAISGFMPSGLEVLYTGDNQVTLMMGKSSATPDGLITGLPKNCALTIKAGGHVVSIPDIRSDCVVLEIKSIDPRATLVEERAKHNGQTQMQLGLFHEKTKYRPMYSIVLYFDASFVSKMTPFVVEFEPETYAIGLLRGVEIWSTDDPTQLVPEGIFSGDCAYCCWRAACGQAVVDSIPDYDTDETLTPETVAALDPLVKEAIAAKAFVEAAEKRKAIADEHLKSYLMTKNRRKAKGPTWSVSWYPMPGKKTLDRKALTAAGIDLTQYEKQGTPFDVLRALPRLEKEEKPKKTKQPK